MVMALPFVMALAAALLAYAGRRMPALVLAALTALGAFAALVFAFEWVLAEDRPGGVHHHQEAARRHRRGGDERAQHAGGRQRDGDGVVGERPAEVLADAPARDADEEEGFEHALEALAGDDDVGGFGGQRGGRAEGDAEVGLGQRRRVVAAVADHGDAALRLEPADDGGLGLGRHAGVHFVDVLAVAVGMLGAGEQHDAAVAAQRLDDAVPGRARAIARRRLRSMDREAPLRS